MSRRKRRDKDKRRQKERETESKRRKGLEREKRRVGVGGEGGLCFLCQRQGQIDFRYWRQIALMADAGLLKSFL